MTTTPQVDYFEEEATSASIAGGGGTGTLDLTLSDMPPGRGIVRLHELVMDSDSVDFDVLIFEDSARTRLNRVVNIENINLHTVQIFGAGGGTQYEDRDIVAVTGTAIVYFSFVNTGAGANTITVRAKYLPYFAR